MDLPLSSGVIISKMKHANAPAADINPAWSMLVKRCIEDPMAAAIVDIAKQAYTFFKCCLTGCSLKLVGVNGIVNT